MNPRAIVPFFMMLFPFAEGRPAQQADGAARARSLEAEIRETLSALVIPEANFKESSLSEVLDFLQKSTDAATGHHDRQRISIVCNDPLLNRHKIDMERENASAMALIGLLSEKSESMVVLKDRSVEFRRRDADVVAPARPLAGEDLVVLRRMENSVVPRVTLEGSTLSDAVEFLTLRHVEVSFANPPPPDNFVILGAELRKAELNLDAINVTIWNLLHLIARQTGASLRISRGVVELRPKDMPEPREVFIRPEGKAMEKAEAIIRRVDVQDGTLDQVVKSLNQRFHPDSSGVSLPGIAISDSMDPEAGVLSFSLRKVPVSTALYYVAILTESRVRFGENVIEFVR